MRILTVWNQISLDGRYAGPGDGWETINWHRVDDEWDRMSIENLSAAGTVLFGRVTYQGFASYWPKQDGQIAGLLDGIDKAVVSHTITEPGWNNARVLNGDLRRDIEALKAEKGGPIIVFGSGKLVQGLSALGLVDDYRLAIVPVALGSGPSLFKADERQEFTLLDTKIFGNGVVMLHCRPNGGG